MSVPTTSVSPSALRAADLARVGLSGLVTKPAPKYICPPDCGSPPMNRAVEINPRFTTSYVGYRRLFETSPLSRWLTGAVASPSLRQAIEFNADGQIRGVVGP